MLNCRTLIIGFFILAITVIAKPAIAASVISSQNPGVVVESQTNTVEAQRQELKAEIVQASAKNSLGRAIAAAKKLIGLENPNDVIYLIGLMNQNLKTPLAKEIKNAILSYERKDYLVTSLKKAGQDQSADINISAANLLIDVKEKLEGLKVMVSLIKKGVMNSEIIDIMDRVPDRQKLNGVQLSDGKIIYNAEIQSELSWIGTTETYPKDVQVFALLMQAAYYYSYLHDLKEKVMEALANADHDYLINALDLIKKAVVVYQHDPNDLLELVKELSKSKDAEVAKKAREINENEERENLNKSREIILNEKKEALTGRLQEIYDFIFRFGDTKNNVQFLIDALNKTNNSEARQAIIKAFRNSKQNELIIPVIKERAKYSTDMKEKILVINSMLSMGLEEDAYLALPKDANELIFQLNDYPGGNTFTRFKNNAVKKKVANYLKTIKNDLTNNLFVRTLAAINSLLFNEESVGNIEVIRTIQENRQISKEGALLIMDSLIDTAAFNPNQIEKIMRIFDAVKQSEDKNISIAASEASIKVQKTRWWRKWQKEMKR